MNELIAEIHAVLPDFLTDGRAGSQSIAMGQQARSSAPKQR
jgi:hypothetical protein